MNIFSRLDNKIIRDLVDQSQIWGAWIEAEDERRRSFLGSMNFELRSGKEYLYKRNRKVAKSLGPRSPVTENILQSFNEGKTENKLRLESLSGAMNRQASILRALDAGRVPIEAAKILRSVRIAQKDAPLRVVGTNALFAYEVLAGVRFMREYTTTGDIDFLQDDRKNLRLAGEDGSAVTLLGLAKKFDKTFIKRGPNDFRMINKDGYMIELIRPESRPPWRATPGSKPPSDDDVTAAPIEGLQWLVNCPSISVVTIDLRGFPVPIKAPDPRVWTAHKFWLADREDRSIEKRKRDLAQANLMFKLISEFLVAFPMDDKFRETLPGELKKFLPEISEVKIVTPDW